jgi:hypothetical protein
MLNFFCEESVTRQISTESYDECLRLKGQMLFVKEWEAIIYLAGPV